MLTYATTNTQLKTRLKGERNALVVLNTLAEARKLPEAAPWEARSYKETPILVKQLGLRRRPITLALARLKTIRSRWVYKVKPDDAHKTRVVVRRWEMVPGLHFGSTFLLCIVFPSSAW